MKIVIAGTIDIDPARREEALKSAKPFIDGALTQPGCLAYSWCADPEVEGRIHVFEEWTGEEALNEHFNKNPHYSDMRDHLAKFELRGAEVSKYRCDKQEPVYDDTGTPRADFFS